MFSSLFRVKRISFTINRCFSNFPFPLSGTSWNMHQPRSVLASFPRTVFAFPRNGVSTRYSVARIAKAFHLYPDWPSSSSVETCLCGALLRTSLFVIWKLCDAGHIGRRLYRLSKIKCHDFIVFSAIKEYSLLTYVTEHTKFYCKSRYISTSGTLEARPHGGAWGRL
jgi:hypothetical protein